MYAKFRAVISEQNGIIHYGKYPYTEIEFLETMTVKGALVCGYTRDEKYWIGEPFSNIGSLTETMLSPYKELIIYVHFYLMTGKK